MTRVSAAVSRLSIIFALYRNKYIRIRLYNYVRKYVAHTCTYMYVSICTYNHTFRTGEETTPTLKNTHRHSHMHAYISRVIHMYIHTNIHTHIYTYIQTYIHTHVHYIQSMIVQVTFIQ